MARLFVAIAPPQRAVVALAAGIAPLHDVPGAPRWIPPERWHLTLAFLGEVAEPPMLRPALGSVAARTAPIALRLDGAGTFPARGAPRVCWIGVHDATGGAGRLAGDAAGGSGCRDTSGGTGRLAGDGSGGLARLAADVRRACASARPHGAAARSRPARRDKAFRPHLTIGRWQAGDAADRKLVQGLANFHGEPWTAAGFALIQSHLGPRPRHETLQRWPLTGGHHRTDRWY